MNKTPQQIRVLIVEHSPADAELLVRELRRADFDAKWHRVETEADYLSSLSPDLDLIFSDFQMPEFTGLRALELLKKAGSEIPFVIVTGTMSEERAVTAIKEGAADYLVKGKLARLGPAVIHALEESQLHKRHKQAEKDRSESEAKFRLLAENITDRTTAETALRDSDATQSSILNALPAQVALINNKGVIVSVNDAWRQFATANALRHANFGIGENYLEVCEQATGSGSENAQTVALGIHRILCGEAEVFTMEYACHSPIAQRWFLLRVVPMHEGRLTGAVVMHVNITDRKTAEEAARKLAAIVESSNDAIFGEDLDNVITSWNRSAEKLYGYSAREMIGTSFIRLIPADRQDEQKQILDRIKLGENVEHFETLRRTKDGRLINISVTASPIKNVAGELIGVSKVVRDVTERKLNEAQLKLQSSALEATANAIVITNTKGVIEWVNPAFTKFTGYSAAEAIGKTPNILKSGKHDDNFYRNLWEAITTGKVWHGEIINRRKDLTLYDEDMTITPIRDTQGQIKHFIAVKQDITEKKKIEAQFMRAQRMESIGTLAGGVAHDLNNILAPIMMSIDVLKEISKDPETTSILETIEISARRGADIVRQVLSFARGLEGERIEVQPIHLLKDVQSILKDTFPKDIRLSFKAPNETWTILGDPTQIHQVLLNLAVNARDAMPNGGTLTMAVENSELDAQYCAMNIQARPGRFVMISVTDSGTGIPQNILDKIFEPFFTTKEPNKGTGLGLSTVMAIVKSHEGVINVYSEPNKGTTFKVYLPALESGANASKEPAKIASLPRGNGETVLVIDDEASILKITTQTLKSFGYQVLTATNGAIAVGVYAQHKSEIAVVLTDMMMPIMDGSATIHALLQINPAIRIIAASGLNAAGDEDKAANLGVKYFLTKPYTARTLLKAMRQILTEA